MPNKPPTTFTTDELLEVWERAVARAYAKPFLMNPEEGSGYEAFSAMAQVFSRVSLAVVRADTDYRLDTAPGPSFATVTLDITKPNVTLAGISVEEGSMFLSTDTNKLYVVEQGQSAVWLAAEVGTKSVTARSATRSYQSNVAAGEIGEVLFIAPGGDDVSLLTVTNPAPATGGVPPMLDAVGGNRGANRQAGEEDETFRARAKSLPDSVCPNAILRGLEEMFAPLGLTAKYWEGWEVGGATDDIACDEPGDAITAFTPELTLGAFYIEVPDVTAVLDGYSGLFCDDGATDWDACDGYPYAAIGFYAGLLAMLRQKKAGGVVAYVCQETPSTP